MQFFFGTQTCNESNVIENGKYVKSCCLCLKRIKNRIFYEKITSNGSSSFFKRFDLDFDSNVKNVKRKQRR